MQVLSLFEYWLHYIGFRLSTSVAPGGLDSMEDSVYRAPACLATAVLIYRMWKEHYGAMNTRWGSSVDGQKKHVQNGQEI